MAKKLVFWGIEGIDEGYFFRDRKEIMEKWLHRTLQAGIDGNKNDGASAIVLSWWYEDDFDEGDEIIYTGAWGNQNWKQVEDQSWSNISNAGLLVSMNQWLPIRVIRWFKHKSKFSPKEWYSYAWLYSVVDAWQEKWKSWYTICRFRLVYTGWNKYRKTPYDIELNYTKKDRKFVETTVLKVVRDTKISRGVKSLYNYECQVCWLVIETDHSRYAEWAHIKPIWRPHNWEDNPNNLICLCPNHHVMFDKGIFSIENDFSFIGKINWKLNVSEKHKIDNQNLLYHRTIHWYC